MARLLELKSFACQVEGWVPGETINTITHFTGRSSISKFGMISRRENLLVRPWQERRYIYHRKKVLSALPAIDVSPPPVRCHVACKMKKLQKEAERCAQIVEDNFTLLQHLRTISNTSRVDNTWLQVPPNFLHRVGIYHPKVGKRRVKDATDITKMTEPKTRKEKCLGCNPHRIIKKETIPEVRVPWDLPKPRLSRKSSSEIREIQDVSRCDIDLPQFRGKIWDRPPPPDSSSSNSKKTKDGNKTKGRPSYPRLSETQSLILSKSGLSVSISFPQSTEILLQGNEGEKTIQREFCECKSFPQIRRKFKGRQNISPIV